MGRIIESLKFAMVCQFPICLVIYITNLGKSISLSIIIFIIGGLWIAISKTKEVEE